MKKVFLSLLLTGAVAGFINAQESVGGIPWSMSNKAALENSRVSVLNLPTPDYAKALKEDEYNESIGRPGKYRAALGVNTNINLAAGNFTYLNDGSIVWRLQVTVPTSQAIKIEYADFLMPKGVTYFVSNGNKNQLMGGYDYTSNANSQTMAHDMIQGDVVNLEMDIKPGVDLNKIQFQVNRVFGLYRGINRINNTFGDAQIQATYGLGESDTCQININCPVTTPWYQYSAAVAHIWITSADTAGAGGGWCSGTLVANTKKDCKPYFLTASHCDDENSYSSDHFKFWEFTFDFRAPLCAGGGTPNTSKVIKGASFRARSYYTIPAGASTGPLLGDFILLELNDPTGKIKAWNRFLAGWDRSNLNNRDKAWVGFHHPAGDVMKFTQFNKLDSTGSFNTAGTIDSVAGKGTHWAARAAKGGIQGGSSGSGLWQANTGRIIGDLSGGITPSAANTCRPNANTSQYSKIYHNWYNEYDSVNFWAGSNGLINASNSRLQPFLDPSNSSTDTQDPMLSGVSSCTLIPNWTPVSVNDVKFLEDGIALYPNPSSGVVNLVLNLQKSTNLSVDVVNILGQKVKSFVIKDASLNQQASIDLSAYSNGIYLFKISTENASITRKIIIKK